MQTASCRGKKVHSQKKQTIRELWYSISYCQNICKAIKQTDTIACTKVGGHQSYGHGPFFGLLPKPQKNQRRKRMLPCSGAILALSIDVQLALCLWSSTVYPGFSNLADLEGLPPQYTRRSGFLAVSRRTLQMDLAQAALPAARSCQGSSQS